MLRRESGAITNWLMSVHLRFQSFRGLSTPVECFIADPRAFSVKWHDRWLILSTRPKIPAHLYSVTHGFLPRDATLCWSNLAPFRRFCSFYVLLTPSLFHPNFGMFTLHRVGVSPRIILKPWNYFRRIPTYLITVPKGYGQTDRRHAIS